MDVPSCKLSPPEASRDRVRPRDTNCQLGQPQRTPQSGRLGHQSRTPSVLEAEGPGAGRTACSRGLAWPAGGRLLPAPPACVSALISFFLEHLSHWIRAPHMPSFCPRHLPKACLQASPPRSAWGLELQQEFRGDPVPAPSKRHLASEARIPVPRAHGHGEPPGQPREGAVCLPWDWLCAGHTHRGS